MPPYLRLNDVTQPIRDSKFESVIICVRMSIVKQSSQLMSLSPPKPKSHISTIYRYDISLSFSKPGSTARSVAMSLGNQEAPRSILASGTSFREDLVMKLFLRPFVLFRWSKKSTCQLIAKGCALSTGYLPLGGLPRNSVDRITDRPDMTSAVDRGRISINPNKQTNFFSSVHVQKVHTLTRTRTGESLIKRISGHVRLIAHIVNVKIIKKTRKHVRVIYTPLHPTFI